MNVCWHGKVSILQDCVPVSAFLKINQVTQHPPLLSCPQTAATPLKHTVMQPGRHAETRHFNSTVHNQEAKQCLNIHMIM